MAVMHLRSVRAACGLLLLACSVVTLLAASAASAERPLALGQSAAASPAKSPSRGTTEPRQALSATDEAAAMAFVKEHHAELASLLRVLRNMNEPQYHHAIRDLSRTRSRLEQFRRRGEDRYELELQAWQTKSRIQLLTARLQMGDSPQLRRELAAVLEQQIRLRREILAAERQRTAERLSKIDEQLERLDGDPAAQAQQQLNELVKRLEASGRSDEKPARGSRPATD